MLKRKTAVPIACTEKIEFHRNQEAAPKDRREIIKLRNKIVYRLFSSLEFPSYLQSLDP